MPVLQEIKKRMLCTIFFFLNPLRGWRTCYSSVPNKKSTRVRHLVSANFSCVQLIFKQNLLISRSQESIKKPDFKIPRKHQKAFWFQDPKKASKKLLISRSQESIKKPSDFKKKTLDFLMIAGSKRLAQNWLITGYSLIIHSIVHGKNPCSGVYC